MGGASGAVAASAHAGCPRFRGTDPLITKQPRRVLAKALPVKDVTAGIPLARWIRAMTFESLIRDEKFASRIATNTVGDLGLPRPHAVVVVDAKSDVSVTRDLLSAARDRATSDGVVTIIYAAAVPHPGFDESSATSVLPDFLIVTQDIADTDDAWVVVGDAKDYERVRSRIDDARMLKGFIQVAFGAESLENWDQLPPGIKVHTWGVLAVPRNSFLQPTTVVEDLTDHRTEVQLRLQERLAEAKLVEWTGNAESFVSHLQARFDPSSCGTCPMFAYCRQELRSSNDPQDFFTELGIPPHQRAGAMGLVDGTGDVSEGASPAVVSQITATINGFATPTGQSRIDVAGLPGTINIVLIKSDGSALGVHGVGIQVVNDSGKQVWNFETFDSPQSDLTRRELMSLLGNAIDELLIFSNGDDESVPRPVHLVVPDKASADLLVSIADSLAGVELSRLRWQHDEIQGRQPLTFDGNTATIPTPLDEKARIAVSFLLEEDRARAFRVRCPVVDLRSAITAVATAGGPAVNSGRLDYLVSWARSNSENPLDTRSFADSIELSRNTPGARLSNWLSDEMNEALGGGKKQADLIRYKELVVDALRYRAELVNGAIDFLDSLPASKLREDFRNIEAGAQQIWRRRLVLQASDLIRFSATSRRWRNSLVPAIGADKKCDTQLSALVNPSFAEEMARDAGDRNLTLATVLSTTPVILGIGSRRIDVGSKIVMLHKNGRPCVECEGVTTKLFQGHLSVSGLVAGVLSLSDRKQIYSREFVWSPIDNPQLEIGDELIVADFDWFGGASNLKKISLTRPQNDTQFAPKASCESNSWYDNQPEHQWCCQPHIAREAANSDWQAQQREAGELNPQIWPPILDADSFDVLAHGELTADSVNPLPLELPIGASMDDLE